MCDFILLFILSALLLTFNSFQLVVCRKCSNKSFRKLSKSQVQVKTYLFPCYYDNKEIFNSTSTFATKHNQLHSCKRKFVIRMTVNSRGEYCSKHCSKTGFIPVDHVIDGITGRRKRLLNPFMIRLKREKMYQLYDLQLVKSVNAEAREEVLNHANTQNYTGCDTSSSHPTCGFSSFNNKIIQFSEGFCCSCDQNKNDQRQPCESPSRENKDFPDMDYAVRHHRSNRTSRDLETAQQKLDTHNFSSDSRKNPIANLNTAVPNLSSQLTNKVNDIFGERNHVEPKKPKNQLDTMTNENADLLDVNEFKPALGDLLVKNVTMRTFEFQHSLDKAIEHTHSPSPFNAVLHSGGESSDKLNKQDESQLKMYYGSTLSASNEVGLSKSLKLEDSAFDYLTDVEGDFNEYFETFKHNKNNLDIDRDKFKLLVMRRIKDDKNKERMLMDDHLNDTKNFTSRKIPREVMISSNGSDFQKLDYIKKNSKNGFLLRIQNDDSEVRLRIITKKPCNTTTMQGNLRTHAKAFSASTKTVTINESTKSNEYNTDRSKQTTNNGTKQGIRQNAFFKLFNGRKNKGTTSTENTKISKIPCTKAVTTAKKHATKTVRVKEHAASTCVTPLILSGTNTELNSINLDSSKKKNSKEIEGLMCNLVPVLNAMHNLNPSENSVSCKKADGNITGTGNETYKIYIELKKKSDKVEDNNSGLVKQFPNFLKPKENAVDPLGSLLSNNHILSDEQSYQNGIKEEPRKQSAENILKSNIPNQFHDNSVQNIQKREATGKTQIRGGQSCSNEGTVLPCNANPETYFESAHCLRFSDLWLNVFKLLNPRLENTITVKIYAKHKTPDKRICWENLTKRLTGRVGTVNEILIDDAKTIMITYSSDDKVAYNLDCTKNYLLVPQPFPRNCKDMELEMWSYGGPEEYLVLKESEITFDGEQCDKAGVNYAAFARQLRRCEEEAGTCLKNQPLHFWRKDKEAEKEGKKGDYFLKNFIEVTDQTFLQNTTSNQRVLRAPYFEPYQSHIVVEMNADHIEIIGDKSEGQITEVYTDATSDRVIVVKAVITNLGVASDYFGMDFTNCTYRIALSDFEKPCKDEIPPQHRITYTATVSSTIKNKRVECKMVLYNQDRVMVATRQIIIVQGHRCMCVWYCQCVCLNYPNPGLPCIPLTVNDYNRAGFPGHLPVTIGSDCSTLFIVLHALLWFFLFLLLFGLIKAVLGLCFSFIALWGLWYLLPDEAKCLQIYLDPRYAGCPVVRDYEGFPIHPRTYKRSDVHFLPWLCQHI